VHATWLTYLAALIIKMGGVDRTSLYCVCGDCNYIWQNSGTLVRLPAQEEQALAAALGEAVLAANRLLELFDDGAAAIQDLRTHCEADARVCASCYRDVCVFYCMLRGVNRCKSHCLCVKYVLDMDASTRMHRSRQP